LGRQQRLVSEVQRVRGSRDRYDVVLEDGSAVRARSEVILRLGIAKGQQLDAAALRRLRSEAELAEAKEAGLSLLSDQARTVADLRRRLEGRGFSRRAVEATIRMLKQQQLLDDEAYAESFVRERLAGRPMGARRIAWELEQRGVDDALVQTVVESHVDPQTEREAALRAARKRLERLKDLDEDAARHKLRAFLARRGFDEDVIADTLDQVCGLPGGA
jgi:regulatory protein